MHFDPVAGIVPAVCFVIGFIVGKRAGINQFGVTMKELMRKHALGEEAAWHAVREDIRRLQALVK